MPEIPFNRDVPEYRTIVPGWWSDLLNAQLASYEGVGEFSEQRVNVKKTSEESAVDDGALKALALSLTLEAGESAGVKLMSSTAARIVEADGAGLDVRYANNLSGNIEQIGSLTNLDLTGSNLGAVFYDQYSSVTFSHSDVIIAKRDRVLNSLKFDGDAAVYVIFTNSGAEQLTAVASVTTKNLEAQVGEYGLAGTTQIEPDTEMSTYNGAN